MDRTVVVKVGAAASASVCVVFGGVALAQYLVAKKKRAGKKTRIIEMGAVGCHCAAPGEHSGANPPRVAVCGSPTRNLAASPGRNAPCSLPTRPPFPLELELQVRHAVHETEME
ncbi:uncharacterized protein V3H82_002147 [Fundulus diaphanus]